MGISLAEFFIRWFVTAVSVFVAAWIVPGIDYTSLTGLAFASLLLGMINALVRPLLLEKGEFPYQWFNSFERFDETALPPASDFHNDLTGDEIMPVDYAREQEVWRLGECRTLADYHDLYLRTDVALLADVFETFRDLMREKHGLDPAHYLTAPGMAWDAMLKLTGV